MQSSPGSAAGSPNKSGEPAFSGSGTKKRDSLGTAPAHAIAKDVGEIYSRIFDHRPVIQGEIRYFIKEFEEKRGLREMRVLENLKNTVFEANNETLPKCEKIMQGNLNEALRRLEIANEMMNRLQQREQENRQLQTEKLVAGETQRRAQWEEFVKEQQKIKMVVDEEHTKAMERLRQHFQLRDGQQYIVCISRSLEKHPKASGINLLTLNKGSGLIFLKSQMYRGISAEFLYNKLHWLH
ncbi:hypothetical protein JRQ81_012418 [Phrynocephalus forsythii]|uniref:Biogenesis of lysosome-related organelles complex 1 subunit 5 n=1 Tax=Phrynocephalus forsythii TaxID=171643 RepID=A0A9Q0Y115_9SAUR|nr:hypothetical protein JRQ81_012418 [Phrynocephalus forsythii]